MSCWFHCVTQVELAKRNGNVVVRGGGDVFYVENRRKPDAPQYEVVLSKPDCCQYVHMHLQPCRHMAAVIFSQGLMRNSRMAKTTIQKYWPKWAHAQVYLRTYKDRAIRQPKLYPGKYTGPEADRMGKPIVPRRRPGRPRKERIGKRST